MQLVGKIAAADAMHIPQVGPVHPNQEVVLVVVAVGELPRRFPGAVDPVLGQLPAGWWIDRVADLLGAGGGGLDVELGFQPGLLHQILHYKFGHWASAYVCVANKKDARRCLHTL